MKELFKEQNELFLVILLAAVLFLSNIWGYDLWAPDEPRFAEISREMIEEGHWIVPHDNGLIYTDKPPLLFWLISVFSILTGGVSSLSARLPSVLAGLGAVAITYIIALRLFGRKTAALSSLVLTTSYMFFDKARTAQTDMLMTFFILLCFLFFYLSQGALQHRRKMLLFFYCALAFAVMTKGPLGFILPLGVILLHLASAGEMKKVKDIFLPEGIILFFVIVVGWIAAATVTSRGEYSVFAALNRHVVERFSEGLHHRQPFYYFLKTFPVDFLPWSLFIPAAVALFFTKLRSVERKESTFLLCWFFFIFVFFTFSREKRNLYILPLFPAASIMVGNLFGKVIGDGLASVPGKVAAIFNYFLSGLLIAAGIFIPAASWVKAREYFFLSSILGAIVIVSAFFIFRLTWKQGWLQGTAFSYFPLFFAAGAVLPAIAFASYPDFLKPTFLMGVVLIAGALFLLFEIRRGFSMRTLIVIILTIAAFYLSAVYSAFPVLNEYKSARHFSVSVAATVKDYLKEGDRLPVYKTYRSAYVFYSGLFLHVIETEEELEMLFSSGERKFCLIARSDIPDVSRSVGSRASFHEISSEDIGHRSMVLISNHP